MTRFEIVRAVERAFDGSSATKQEIVAAATTEDSRTEVVALLDQLPQRSFRHVRDLWDYLPAVPLGDD